MSRRNARRRAGLVNIAELFGEFQQSNLGADDLLFGRHLQCTEAWHANLSAPRPASAVSGVLATLDF